METMTHQMDRHHYDYDAFDSDFRSDYDTRYGRMGRGYEHYQPAYRFGYDLAHNERYHGRDWNDFEADARRDWDDKFKEGWDDFKDAVRHAWDSVTGKERHRRAA